MTRAEANAEMKRAAASAEIARRIWPHAQIEASPTSSVVNVKGFDKSDEAKIWWHFNPFVDEAARQELVTFVQRDVMCLERFTVELDRITLRPKGEQWYQTSFRYLLATPEQITIAAGRTLGIEVEGE